jgi:glutaminyl-tRNA synthetase
VRLYDRLFNAPPSGGNYLIRPKAKHATSSTTLGRHITTIRAQVEGSLGDVTAETVFQFERHGYFVADRFDTKPGNPVFNRTVTLRDSWGKAGQ